MPPGDEPTSLRRTHARARTLGPEAQLRECIDHVENPAVLVEEAVDAFVATSRRGAAAVAPTTGEARVQEPILAEFRAGRDLMVPANRGAFTCLASDVEPCHGTGSGDASRNGFDFVGITCDQDAQPVLGVLQSEHDATAYTLFLRLLASLAELAAPAVLSSTNERAFHGMLGKSPTFDLYLVIFAEQDEARTPLCELTRDLAETVRDSLCVRTGFPRLLREVTCLRMNPLRFDGRLRLDWRL